MKLAPLILVATTALTACRHAEVARRQLSDPQASIPVNPIGTFPGHPPTKAEIQSFSKGPTPEQVAADRAIAQQIVGTWTATESSDSAQYPVLLIRTDGTYTVTTNQKKLVSE